MTETADVIRFKAGDTVPDWMLIIEPSDGRAHGRAKLVFQADTVVFDAIDGIFACPVQDSPGAFTVVGSGAGFYMAESKVVRVATAQVRLLPVRPLPPSMWMKAKPSAWWRRFWPF